MLTVFFYNINWELQNLQRWQTLRTCSGSRLQKQVSPAPELTTTSRHISSMNTEDSGPGCLSITYRVYLVVIFSRVQLTVAWKMIYSFLHKSNSDLINEFDTRIVLPCPPAISTEACFPGGPTSPKERSWWPPELSEQRPSPGRAMQISD